MIFRPPIHPWQARWNIKTLRGTDVKDSRRFRIPGPVQHDWQAQYNRWLTAHDTAERHRLAEAQRMWEDSITRLSEAQNEMQRATAQRMLHIASRLLFM